MEDRYYSRIDKIEDINILSRLVCEKYNIGNLLDNTYVIRIGYEDFNAILTTSTGKYLMKVFANVRTDQDCIDCVLRMNEAYVNNIATPKVFENNDKEVLSFITYKNSRYRVVLIEYIYGDSFFDLNRKPNINELKQIINIAINMNKLNYKPPFIYDSWAITSFLSEYEDKKKYLTDEYINLVEPIYQEFKNFDYDSLPKSFVHGDMMSTNLMVDKNGKVWVIDFSVSNYMARINELIVLCSDIALLNDDKAKTIERLTYLYEEWCKNIHPNDNEQKSFILLYKVANAINIVKPYYELISGNKSNETLMHLNSGIYGLSLVEEIENYLNNKKY